MCPQNIEWGVGGMYMRASTTVRKKKKQQQGICTSAGAQIRDRAWKQSLAQAKDIIDASDRPCTWVAKLCARQLCVGGPGKLNVKNTTQSPTHTLTDRNIQPYYLEK